MQLVKKCSALSIVLVTSAFLGGCHSEPTHGGVSIDGAGPIRGQRARSAYAVVASPGRVFTDGNALIDIPGNQPATIIKVESLEGQAAAEYLGAKLANPVRPYTVTVQAEGWPPSTLKAKSIVNAEGVSVEPTIRTWHTQAYELLMGYRIDHDVFAVRAGIRVTYRIGGTTYRATFPSAIAFCPTGQDQDACRQRGFAETS